MIERRARDLAIEGRTARGIALPYGVAADVRLPTGAIAAERFEAGAILYSPGLQVNRNHDAGDVLADLAAGTLRSLRQSRRAALRGTPSAAHRGDGR